MESQRVSESRAAAELPYPSAPLTLRLECCNIDLPARVLEVLGTRVFITAPVHPCRRPELGVQCSAIWQCKMGLASSTGYVESHRRLPPSWVLRFEGPIEQVIIEERYPDDSPGTLIVDGTRVPVRVIDRSEHGAGCLVPAVVRLRVGQHVRIVVGKHERTGAVARVQVIGNQLRVGLRLDNG
jgi:hypothetical protein